MKNTSLDIFDSHDFDGEFIAFYDKEFYPSDEMGPTSIVATLQGIRFPEGDEVTTPEDWKENNEFVSWREIEDSINHFLNN